MSLDLQSRAGVAEIFEPEPDFEITATENVVTATVAAFTVLFVSSMAVLMYLA